MDLIVKSEEADKLSVHESAATVSRQDSGMPAEEEEEEEERLVEPKGASLDGSDAMNDSECNVTVIHVVNVASAGSGANIPVEDETTGTPVADNDKKDYPGEGKDGSDSGVEGCAAEPPRVQSRNSVDYASSCNGLDEASCDSSLVSCCSVYEDPCATLPDDMRLSGGSSGPATTNGATTNGPASVGVRPEGTSEAGSESSSIAGSVSAARCPQKRPATVPGAQNKKKPVAHTADSHQRTSSSQRNGASAIVNGTTSTGARAKPRVLTKSQSVTSSSSSSRDRGRSREKSSAKGTRDGSLAAVARNSSTTRSSSVTASTAASRSRTRPDSLPSALTTEINKDLAAQRGRGTSARAPRGGSSTRASTRKTGTPNSTPSEDGRKSLGRSTSLYGGRPDATRNARFLDKMAVSMDTKTLDAYGTLPRAGARSTRFAVPKSAAEKPPVASRSRSGSRDASLNRLLGRKAINGSSNGINGPQYKGLPPYPKQKMAERTRIYHETSVQTGLTGKDIDNCLAGVATIIPNPESVETSERPSQTEGTWEDLQRLKADLKKTSEESEVRKKDNEKLKAEVAELRKKLEEEQADHAFARQELDKNAQRVLAMLGTPQSEHADGNDSFLELESHFQSSGQVLASQQVEIADLQSLCRMLSRDLEKNIAAQKQLILQQQELEAESLEMQDFLQEEKATLETALKESEAELKRKDEKMQKLSSELERQTEECKHLVRISEQRRQENLSLSMKLNAVERRSKELLLAQGAAASGASVALSGLGSRLEALVDQLIVSYNISEKDLEDVIYHNEAFSRSNSSIESSPVSSKHSIKDCTPSPKRGSFVSAVIGAIRNAATHPFATKHTSEKKSSESSKVVRKDLSIESSSDILDFETEPCLMMESVLEDVPLPDTYSHNMVSSSDSLRRVLNVPETVEESVNINGESSSSLTNLTQAILHRRRVEDEEEENCESISESENGPSEATLPMTEYCPATSLVDQVIDVDNLVTKLLKVLRIIQLDNDTCIQELKDDKIDLETRLEMLLAEKKTAENSKEFERGVLSNGLDDRNSIIENCKYVIKEMNDVKELIVDGAEKDKRVVEESKDGDQNANATVLLSSSVCF
ncbi:uncharacterized protein LOC106635865 isoform X2 [Copidosoma floridanum]|uniref:uncharacterized protein LOC106635865 isoform X2 n=1 Tax=Copidosoma floridanum TaxID=29053 RepID=UPI000C6F7144|nr:uncharacterized protein LOC106635865 isoform X2 [Copidosoma floridanum]